jgi:hypothetical protein
MRTSILILTIPRITAILIPITMSRITLTAMVMYMTMLTQQKMAAPR